MAKYVAVTLNKKKLKVKHNTCMHGPIPSNQTNYV